MKNRYHVTFSAATLCLIFFGFEAVRAGLASHDHQEIVELASSFVNRYYSPEQSSLEVVVREPDSRLNLPRCTRDLEAFWPYEPGSQREVSVGIRCSGESKWKLYLNAALSQFEEVAVLNTSVRSGQTLDESMVSMRRVDVLKHRYRAIRNVGDFTGMKFSRSIQSGTPLFRESLKIPATIKRGDFVTILSGQGIVEVAAEGYAMTDGYVNDTIKVRNSISKKVVQALVLDQSTVKTR